MESLCFQLHFSQLLCHQHLKTDYVQPGFAAHQRPASKHTVSSAISQYKEVSHT